MLTLTDTRYTQRKYYLRESVLKNKIFLACFTAVLLSGCATKELDPIEQQKQQAELIERCKKLKKEIDELKGKPVRRSAAIEYFNDQCFVKPDPSKY